MKAKIILFDEDQMLVCVDLCVSICVCRSVCVENLEKAFGDPVFVFGEITMPGKTSQPTQEDNRAMAAATEGVRQVVGCEFSYIERE